MMDEGDQRLLEDMEQRIIERIDGMHAEMVTGFAEVNTSLRAVLLANTNLFNMVVAHTTDPRAHGDAA